jgi:hypothetical protein
LFFVYAPTVPPETITLDKWFMPASEPVRTRAAAIRTTWNFYQWTPPTIVPDMDSWFMPIAQPYLVQPPNVGTGLQVLVEFSTPAAPAVTGNLFILFGLG